MILDKPKTNEIERLAKTFSFRTDSFLPNVSLQELGLVFQELAGKQVDLLGIGSEYSKRTNNVYVLCREKMLFLKELKLGEDYTLVTYPLTPGKLQMQREAYLLDSLDEVVLKLDSIWVLVDYVTRRMKRTTDVASAQSKYPAFDTFVPLFEKRLEALGEMERGAMDLLLTHKVSKSDLDSNNHMNNTIYLRLVQPFVAKGISEVEIDFEKECLLGETLSIYKKEEKDFVSFMGYKEDDCLSFKARISFF